MGRPLEGPVRSGMEARFAHDFSRVRVHSDAQAAADARAHGAIAYTTGSHIYFGAGHFRPDTGAGRRLLAHELAHVVQQAGVPATEGPASVSSPGERAERAAHEAAHAFGGPGAPDPSVALGLRDALRATRASRPILQRAVSSWAGDFSTDKYTKVLDSAKQPVGVDIVLRFKPGKHVNAERIAMVQMVTTKDTGKVVAVDKTVGARSIAPGKAGEGAHIDQLAKFRNPLYATGAAGAKDTLAGTATNKQWGQHGWRFVDKAKKLHQRDALLKDTPEQDPHGPNSSQVFESAAVAVQGLQKGAWYGSVQWGWTSDAANKFTQLPLTLVQKDVPTGTFSTAAGLWAANKTSTGAATIPLPMIMGKYANTAGVHLVADPAKPAGLVGKLPKNARVEVTDQGVAAAFNKAAKVHWWKVTVVDGPLIGRVGWVMESLLSDAVTP